MKSPQSLNSSMQISPIPSACLYRRDTPGLWSFSQSSFGPAPIAPHPSYAVGHRPGYSIPHGRGGQSPPSLCGHPFVWCSPVGPLGCKTALLDCVQLFNCQSPKVLLYKSTLNEFSQSAYVSEVAPPECNTLHLTFLNLMRFVKAHFFEVAQVSLHGIPPFYGVSCTTQLRVVQLYEVTSNFTFYVIDKNIEDHIKISKSTRG